jgi:hypothetical protein
MRIRLQCELAGLCIALCSPLVLYTFTSKIALGCAHRLTLRGADLVDKYVKYDWLMMLMHSYCLSPLETSCLRVFLRSSRTRPGIAPRSEIGHLVATCSRIYSLASLWFSVLIGDFVPFDLRHGLQGRMAWLWPSPKERQS